MHIKPFLPIGTSGWSIVKKNYLQSLLSRTTQNKELKEEKTTIIRANDKDNCNKLMCKNCFHSQ